MGGDFLPPMDVVEASETVMITMEVPGIVERDIDVRVHDGMLSICGEKKPAQTEGEKNVSERRYGHFERSVVLPNGVDKQSMSRSVEQGVLRVVLAKKSE